MSRDLSLRLLSRARVSSAGIRTACTTITEAAIAFTSFVAGGSEAGGARLGGPGPRARPTEKAAYVHAMYIGCSVAYRLSLITYPRCAPFGSFVVAFRLFCFLIFQNYYYYYYKCETTTRSGDTVLYCTVWNCMKLYMRPGSILLT
jgi:hypothetical protein